MCVCVCVYRDLECLAKCQPCCHYLMNFNMSGFTISPELKTSFYIFKPSYLDSILIKYWCVHIKFLCVQYFHRFNFARNKFWICKMISSLCDLPIYYQHLACAVISRFSSCKNSKGLNCSHFLCKMTKRLIFNLPA